MIQALIKIFRRPIFPEPMKGLYLNGCCLPAVRKVFVTVDGNISLCERIHNGAPSLGNIRTGIDIKKMKKIYVEESSTPSLPYCAKCWANRLCRACYVNAYTDEHFDLEKKEKRCKTVLKSVERGLKFYTKLLKIDPEGLNYLADIEVS